jgi:hypothetical protein
VTPEVSGWGRRPAPSFTRASLFRSIGGIRSVQGVLHHPRQCKSIANYNYNGSTSTPIGVPTRHLAETAAVGGGQRTGLAATSPEATPRGACNRQILKRSIPNWVCPPSPLCQKLRSDHHPPPSMCRRVGKVQGKDVCEFCKKWKSMSHVPCCHRPSGAVCNGGLACGYLNRQGRSESQHVQ